MTESSIIIDIIKKALNNLSIKYIEENDYGIRLNYRNTISDYVIVARLDTYENIIKIIGTSFMKIDKKWLSHTDAFITYINNHNELGYFSIEQESMELRFYISIPYDIFSQKDLNIVIQTTIIYSCQILLKYLKIIMLLSEMMITGKEAIEMAIQTDNQSFTDNKIIKTMEHSFNNTNGQIMITTSDYMVKMTARAYLPIIPESYKGLVSLINVMNIDLSMGKFMICAGDKVELAYSIGSFHDKDYEDIKPILEKFMILVVNNFNKLLSVSELFLQQKNIRLYKKI